MSLDCKLVPVQYREYEYCLFLANEMDLLKKYYYLKFQINFFLGQWKAKYIEVIQRKVPYGLIFLHVSF